MVQKWNVGDEVEVSFIGTIKEVSIIGSGAVRYKVDNGDYIYSTTAYCVKEDYIHSLPIPPEEVR